MGRKTSTKALAPELVKTSRSGRPLRATRKAASDDSPLAIPRPPKRGCAFKTRERLSHRAGVPRVTPSTVASNRPFRKIASPSSDHVPLANAARDRQTMQQLQKAMTDFRNMLTKANLGEGLIEHELMEDVRELTKRALGKLDEVAAELA